MHTHTIPSDPYFQQRAREENVHVEHIQAH